jgi:hypothetical protein
MVMFSVHILMHNAEKGEAFASLNAPASVCHA